PALRAEGRAVVAPRVLDASTVFDLQGHRAGHAVDAEIPRHPVALPRALDGPAGKGHRRKLRRVEEVRGLQVCVPLRLARVDAVDVDADVDLRPQEVTLFELHHSAELAKTPVDLRDHQMPHREAHGGMTRVDVPDAHVVVLRSLDAVARPPGAREQHPGHAATVLSHATYNNDAAIKV